MISNKTVIYSPIHLSKPLYKSITILKNKIPVAVLSITINMFTE